MLCTASEPHSILVAKSKENKRQKYLASFAKHPFLINNFHSGNKLDKKRGLVPTEAYQQDYILTMDPATGKPEPQRLFAAYQMLRSYQRNLSVYSSIPGATTNSNWQERGPNNVGGRTRALMFDPNDSTSKKLWAGGVSGGLWYNNDITNPSSSWQNVNDFWANLAVSCITFDPNNHQIMYVGTGESYSAASRGSGIWKSTDGGMSWNLLQSTLPFFYVNDIKVRNENGLSVIYAAIDGKSYMGQFHGLATAGLQRSIDGGSSWTQVLPNIPGTAVNFVASDIEIATNNSLWVGTKASPFAVSDKGGGRILKSNDGINWTLSHHEIVGNPFGRVELACAPSDPNYLYALVEDSLKLKTILSTTNGGNSWNVLPKPIDADLGIPAADFTRNQAFYNLILCVHPSNRNHVLAGGINLHMSTTGGNSWTQISRWSNNPNMGGQAYSLVHADQHQIISRPGHANAFAFGNDGGVYYSDNILNAASTNTIEARKLNYNVTQFYTIAMDESIGSNFYLGGTQDNGTQRFNSNGLNSTSRQFSGDGAFCFIDKLQPNTAIVSSSYNSYFLFDGSTYLGQLLNDNNSGFFVNPADYDSQNKILYSSKNNGDIYRINAANTQNPVVTTVNIGGMTDRATAITVSPFSLGASRIYIGTISGKLYRIDNAQSGNSKTAIDLSGINFPLGSIGSIEFGKNENQMLVSFKNYGIPSVWYTSDGGLSWSNKSGNLPDMPIRWAMMNPNDSNAAVLATEVGIWASDNFQSSQPTWLPSNSGLANVRVDQLRIRRSDNLLLAATHGRGVFTNDAFAKSIAPIARFKAEKQNYCWGDSVQFLDQSVGANHFLWSFQGGIPSTSTAKSPKVFYPIPGNYNVQLRVSNDAGVDTLYQSNYIKIQEEEALLRIVTDNYPQETRWEITDSAGFVYAADGPYPSSAQGDTFNYALCIPNNHCLFFKIYDSFGDGICCNFGNGSFALTDIITGNTLFDGGRFGDSLIIPFCLPPRNPKIIMQQSTDSICPGDNVTISATAFSGSGSFQYLWSNGQNSSSIVVNPQQTITYSLSVFDGFNSASDTTSIFVHPEITVDAGNDQSINAGNSTILNGSIHPIVSSAIFNWSPSALLLNPDSLTTITTQLLDTNVFVFAVRDSINQCTFYDSVMVNVVTPPLQLTLVADTTEICSGDSLGIIAVGSGGNLNYHFFWESSSSIIQNLGDSLIIKPTQSEIFKITLTSGNQQITDSIQIIVNAIPNVVLTNPLPVIMGQSAVLQATAASGSGFYIYQWAPAALIALDSGNIARSIPLFADTLITVQAIDSITHCIGNTDTAQISVLPPPLQLQINLTTDSVCFGDSLLHNASVSGGMGNYQYQWRYGNQPISNQSAAHFTPQNSDWLYLEVVDGQQQLYDSVFIYVYPDFQMQLFSSNVVLAGDSALVWSVVSPHSSSYLYQWQPDSFLLSPNKNSTSTLPIFSEQSFKLTVTDSLTNCSKTDSIFVDTLGSPIRLQWLNFPDSICFGDSLLLEIQGRGGVSNLKFDFSSPLSGRFIDTGPTFGLAVFQSSWWFVDVYDSLNTVRDSVFINVNAPIVVNAGNDTSVTANLPINLSGNVGGGSGLGNFQWISGNVLYPNNLNTATLPITIAQNFVLQYVDAIFNCTKTDTLRAAISNTPMQLHLTLQDSMICLGDTTTIFATYFGGNGIYNLSANGQNILSPPNQFPMSIAPTSSGFYRVVINNNQDSLVDSIFVEVGQKPNIVVSPDTVISWNSSVNLSAQTIQQGAFGFNWQPDTLFSNSQGNNVSTVLLRDSTLFSIELIDSLYGCKDTAFIKVDVLPELINNFSLSADSVCTGDSIQVSLNLQGGSGNYQVQSTLTIIHQQIPSFSWIADSSKWLFFTINDGFQTVEDSVYIYVHPEIILNAGAYQQIIAGQPTVLSASLSGGSGNFFTQWQPDTLLANANSLSTLTDSLYSNQWFSFQVVDLQNGCSAKDSLLVEITFLDSLKATINANKLQLCKNDSLFLSGTAQGGFGNYSYLWTDSSGNILSFRQFPGLLLPTSSWIYLSISDGFSQTKDSIFIEIVQARNIQYSHPTEICSNLSPFDLQSNFQGIFISNAIDDGLFNPNLAAIGSNNILFRYALQNCNFTDSFNITVKEAPTAEIINSIDSLCLTDSSYMLFGLPFNGVFLGTGIINNNAFSPELAGIGQHLIRYLAFANNGCSDTAKITLRVVDCGYNGNAKLYSTAEDIQIYPNPSNGEITLHSSIIKERTFQVNVHDYSGKLVYSKDFAQQNSNSTPLNLQFLSQGIYNLNLISNSRTINQFFIVR